jgi:hypothetical protein
MTKIKLVFTLLLTVALNAQGNFNGNNVGASQQALIDLGNRSSRTPQPLNVQGSHYFDEEFKKLNLSILEKNLVTPAT